MKLKHLFYFQSLVFLNSLGFIFAPAALLRQFGLSPTADLIVAYRDLGGLLLFVALISWFSARAEDTPFRRKVRLSFFILQSVLFVVSAYNLLVGNPALAPSIWISLVMALAFGYFQFIRPDA